MPDRMRAVDRPDVEATFDHNDHCVGEGWSHLGSVLPG